MGTYGCPASHGWGTCTLGPSPSARSPPHLQGHVEPVAWKECCVCSVIPEAPATLVPTSVMPRSMTMEEGWHQESEFRFLSPPASLDALFLTGPAPATGSFPSLSLCQLPCTLHSFPGLKEETGYSYSALPHKPLP